MSTFKWYIIIVVVVIVHTLSQPFKVFSVLERRLLTTRLELSFQDALKGSFQDSLENLLNDQMVGREFWIRLNTLKDSVTGRQIFEKVIRSQYGLHEIWLEDEEQLLKNLAFIKAFEEKTGALISIVPHSGSLLKSSYHELSVLFTKEGYPELRDQFLSLASPTMSFYKADHHLNHLATPIMAKFVLEHLDLPFQLPSLTYCADFLGTLSPYYLSLTPQKDALWVYDAPIESITFNNQTLDSLHDLKACQGVNPYQGLLHGNHGLMNIKTGVNNGQRLLLIKDSHAHQLIPFLTYHYETIDVIDLRHFNGSIQTLLDQGYDDVVVFVGEGSVREDRSFFKLNR
jgi:hypothetical protein